MSSLTELSWQGSETGSLVGVLLKYLPWQYDIYAFQRCFMSSEYPLICSESYLLLLRYFSGHATFESVMVFVRWCLVLPNPSKSCSVLISVKLYFIPKQSDLSLGVKVHKSLLNGNSISLCMYFAAKILFFTLGDQQPLNIAGTTVVPFHARGELAWFGRQWGHCSEVSGINYCSESGRVWGRGITWPWGDLGLVSAVCDTGCYLSILLFRASLRILCKNYSPFPGNFLESIG